MSTVAVLVPVLGRPHRVKPLVQSIARGTPEPHSILFICDSDDRPTQDEVALAGCRMISPGGTYSEKINAGIAATTEPLLFLAADDLHFHRGWLTAAAAHMRGPVGVVGTNDLGNRRVIAGEHATHSLVARWYAEVGTIDEPGKLLHEGYQHCFTDDELVATAKKRGAWAFAADAIVEHQHPDWGKADRDPIYDKGQATFRDDRRVFRTRRQLWA